MHEHEPLLRNVLWLIRAAQKIGVPVAAVEQYPKGLGRTVADVRDAPARGRHRAEAPVLRGGRGVPAAAAGRATARRSC